MFVRYLMESTALVVVFDLQAAYDRGANYIYRVNDDSEMHTPWARSFVNALEVGVAHKGVVP